jgi:hypothetical protein
VVPGHGPKTIKKKQKQKKTKTNKQKTTAVAGRYVAPHVHII